MSWRDAPLYVEAHDLASWILPRVAAWPRPAGRYLAGRVAAAAFNLVAEISLALTFPKSRASHLEQADEAIVVLRTGLRLARGLNLLSSRRLRFACERLRIIGRMVGGWRKRLEETSSLGGGTKRATIPGDGLPAA